MVLLQAAFAAARKLGAQGLSALRLRPRGLALLAFLLYLLALPAFTQRDIIASELSLSLLGLTLGAIILTSIWGRRLKRAVTLSCTISSPLGGLRDLSARALASKSRLTLVISATPFSLPPLYGVTLRLLFSNGTTLCERQRFIGSSLSERVASCSIEFPHRGVWRIEGIEVELGDVLGVTVYRWTAPASPAQEFRIVPPPAQVTSLPIMSSSHRSGDSQIDINARAGEPFDLKRYHPSDGLGKIAWKIFARRGELLSRHPEPSMTPEGKVFLYVMASRGEDQVASAAIAYARKVSESEVTPFTACEGMGTAAVTKTPEDAERLLIECVWNRTTDLAASDLAAVARLISAGSTGDGRGVKVLVFLSREAASRPEGSERLIKLGTALVARAAQPVFIVCDSSTPVTQASIKATRMSGILRLFVELPAPQQPKGTEADYDRFIGVCAQHRWTVLLSSSSARTTRGPRIAKNGGVGDGWNATFNSREVLR